MNCFVGTPGYIVVGLLTAGQPSLIGTAGSNPLSSMLTILGAIVVLVLVLFLAYKSTQFIGKKYSVENNVGGGNIEIIERTILGPDRAIVIVKLRDRVLLLGVTSNHIEKLADLDPLYYENLPSNPSSGDSFAVLMKDTLSKGFGNILGNKKD